VWRAPANRSVRSCSLELPTSHLMASGFRVPSEEGSREPLASEVLVGPANPKNAWLPRCRAFARFCLPGTQSEDFIRRPALPRELAQRVRFPLLSS